MRILIIGSNKVWALENIYYRHLNELGCETELYPIHNFFYDYYYRSPLNKLLYKSGLSGLIRRLNKDLIKYVSNKRYDIIWVFKGMEILPATIEKLRQTGAKLVNFNPDHPFMFAGKGSGNKNVFNSIGLYDMHLCYNREVMHQILNNYHVKCDYLPFGYEPVKVSFPNKNDEILKACFIGNPDSKRVQYLQNLIDKGIPLDVYGNNWSNFIKHSRNTSIFSAIYGDDFYQIAPLYRVQINIFRSHNEGSHNMRTFEMPGLGCIIITPTSEEQKLFFHRGEIYFYNDEQALARKTQYLMSLSYEDSMQIRNKAAESSKKFGYDYLSRAKSVISVFEDLVKK